MTIQKKSLISSLKTTKKAIVASAPVAPSASTTESRLSTRRSLTRKANRKAMRKMTRSVR